MNPRQSVVCRPLVVLLAAVTLTVAGPYVSQAAEEMDVVGEYFCRGDNPDGGTYSGKVVITKTGETYKIQWTIGRDQENLGVGIREGNVLSVCFVGDGVDGVAGVVAYKIQKREGDLRLVGRWAVMGEQKTRTETLSKRRPKVRHMARK